LASITVTVVSYQFKEARVDESKKEVSQVEFSFQLRDEKHYDGVGGPMWVARMVLPIEHYSKDNLDLLFCSFSKKHPDENERLQVLVYTDAKKIDEANMPADLSLPSRHDAWFYRNGDGVASGGGRNEYYVYRPNPDNLGEDKTVVLRGTFPSASKKVIRTWKPSHKSIKIRAIVYEIPSVNPSRTYYSFQSPEEGSDYWRTVLTFQQEGDILAASDHVRFVNDKIAYIFIGFLFAVTTDGGETWSTWDAGRDLEGIKCFEESRIQEVNIAPNGEGVLFLRSLGTNSVRTLHTKDFGKQWVAQW
jgi:hypothetical protein